MAHAVAFVHSCPDGHWGVSIVPPPEHVIEEVIEEVTEEITEELVTDVVVFVVTVGGGVNVFVGIVTLPCRVGWLMTKTAVTATMTARNRMTMREVCFMALMLLP